MISGIKVSEEDSKLLNSEEKFFSAFGISADYELRKEILILKSEVSIPNIELKILHEAGLLKVEPKGHCRVWIEMSLYKFCLSALEIALFMILYCWPIFLYSTTTKVSLNMNHLVIAMVVAVIGFLLAYYLFQRNIRPYFILRKHNFRFGDRYEPTV